MTTATTTRVDKPQRLLPKQHLRALTQRTDRQGLYQCAGQAGLISVKAPLVYLASGFWVFFAMLVHGVALVALFAPLHEASHWTVFRHRWPNRVLTWVTGLVLLLPPTWFRHYHLAHHRHTQDPARDPELAEPKPQTLGQYLWVITGIPYWRAAVVNL